jgi:hypothetical protein
MPVIQGQNNYKVVEVTGFTSTSAIQNELNAEEKLLYYLNSVVTIGAKVYFIFGTQSVNRLS